MVEISLKSSDLLYLSCAIHEVVNPKGVVQIIIGVKEHKSRYIDLITFLNNNGFNVFISDTRGHGRSVSGANPLGYIDDADKLLKDQDIIINFLKGRYPNLPIYVIADSLGSEIALGYIQKNAGAFAKLVLCSPIKHDKSNEFFISTARLLLKFKKGTKNSLVLNNALGDFSLEKLVKDFNARAKIKNDALCNFNYSTLAMGNLLLLNKDNMTVSKYQNVNENLEILIMYGVLDEVNGGKRQVDFLVNLLKRIGYNRIMVKEYNNMYHKILFETGANLVFNDILQFLV